MEYTLNILLMQLNERIDYMDKNEPGFNFPPYMNYDIGCDPVMGDPGMFNPVMQYEQAYMYYKYLSMQLEYKIKCKEYEQICDKQRNRDERKGA